MPIYQVFPFFPVLLVFLIYLRNHCLTRSPEDLLLFSSTDFIILALKFGSVIHFELFFMYGVG